MQAPTAADSLNELVLQQALEEAWKDSLSDDPVRRHEEGGWIYMNVTTGELLVRRAPAGEQTILDVSAPPLVAGAVAVATFHAHPNPRAGIPVPAGRTRKRLGSSVCHA